jgi:hypothetical protein
MCLPQVSPHAARIEREQPGLRGEMERFSSLNAGLVNVPNQNNMIEVKLW